MVDYRQAINWSGYRRSPKSEDRRVRRGVTLQELAISLFYRSGEKDRLKKDSRNGKNIDFMKAFVDPQMSGLF